MKKEYPKKVRLQVSGMFLEEMVKEKTHYKVIEDGVPLDYKLKRLYVDLSWWKPQDILIMEFESPDATDEDEYEEVLPTYFDMNAVDCKCKEEQYDR